MVIGSAMNELVIPIRRATAPSRGRRLILMSIVAALLLTALFVLSGLD